MALKKSYVKQRGHDFRLPKIFLKCFFGSEFFRGPLNRNNILGFLKFAKGKVRQIGADLCKSQAHN
jgi:hypothetical protein